MAITVVSTSSAEANPGPTISIPVPTGIQADDIAIVCIAANGFAGGGWTEPTGWTSLGFLSGADAGEAWYKKLTGSEGAADFEFTAAGTTQFSGVCAVYRGVDPTTPIEVEGADIAEGTASTSHVTSSVTTTSAGARVVSMATGDFASGGSFSPSSPASLVERVERIQASAFIAAAIYDEDRTSAGAGAHTIASNQSIRADLWIIALKPAGGTTFTQTLSATATGSASMARRPGIGLSAAATGAASMARSVRATLSAAATGTAGIVRQARLGLAASATGTATIAASKTILQTIAATATGTATIALQIGKALSAAATGSPTMVRQARLGLAATATVTSVIVKRAALGISASAVGSASLTASRTVLVMLSAVATGTASMVRRVALTLSTGATGTPGFQRLIDKTLPASGTGIASLTATGPPSVIPTVAIGRYP